MAHGVVTVWAILAVESCTALLVKGIQLYVFNHSVLSIYYY